MVSISQVPADWAHSIVVSDECIFSFICGADWVYCCRELSYCSLYAQLNTCKVEQTVFCTRSTVLQHM